MALTRAETIPRQAIGDQAFIEALLIDEGTERSWMLRFTHRDKEDDHLEWTTEVGILEVCDGALDFSCSNYLTNVDGTLAPMRRSPSRPRIVPDLLTSFGGNDEMSLSASPRILTNDPKALGDFLQLLYCPARRHPVIHISAANINDRPVIDGDGVASWLAGLAYVFVAKDRFPSLALRDRVPQQLNCWDGAVRIYWPGFRAMDPPFRHRFWSREYVRHIDNGPGKGFKEYLLGRISTFAVYNVHDRFLTWNDILNRNRRIALSTAASQGDYKKQVEECAAYNDELRDQLTALHKQLQSQAVALEQAGNERDSWREAYQQAARGVAPPEDQIDVPLIGVADAVQRAARTYPKELALALNGHSEVEKNPFEEPQEVFSALSFLATTYRDAKMKKRACSDFDRALRSLLESWSYSGGQKRITMGKYPGWYRCTWNGKKYTIEEHIGVGTSKDPRYTIRIAFAWDSTENKVVVGFIGQHQKDDNT